MIEIKIPAEIRDYKSKLLLGLSVRQIIALAVALIVCIPVGIFGHGHIPDDILPWIIILLAAPCIGYGFFTFQGMQFEEFIRVFLSLNFLPQKRVFEDTEQNLFLSIKNELMENATVQSRIESGEYHEEWSDTN